MQIQDSTAVLHPVASHPSVQRAPTTQQSSTATTQDNAQPHASIEPPPNAPPASQPPVILQLTAGDRAAIASATGFYISATGEVTPDGPPPWIYIMQYARQLRPERVDLPTEPVPAGNPATDQAGDEAHVDVLA